MVKAEEKHSTMRILLVGLLLMLSLYPFLHKPPAIDEESYLFIAEKVAVSPFKPYDWWRAWQPYFGRKTIDFFIYAHPPLFPYLLSFFNEYLKVREITALRISMLPFPILFISTLYLLANPLLRSPTIPIVLILFSPILHLIFENSLMIDLPFTTLSLISITFLLNGMRHEKREKKRLSYAISGLFIALASLTKYPGLMLLPLLLIGPFLKNGRNEMKSVLPGICIFILIFSIWCIHNILFYGRIHLIFVLQKAHEIMRSPLFTRFIGTMIQLSLFPIILLSLPVAIVEKERRFIPILSLILSLFITILYSGFNEYTPIERILLCISISTGIWLISRFGIAPLIDIVKRFKEARGRDPKPIEFSSVTEMFLSLWFLLVLLSVIFFHNFASSRYLGPLLPPLIILLSMRVESLFRMKGRHILLSFTSIATTILTLSLGVADMHFAQSYRLFSEEFEKRYGKDQPSVWFTGEWGMRYFMEREGHIFYTDFSSPPPAVGDLVVFPQEAVPSSTARIARRMTELDRFIVTDRFPIRLMNRRARAGYYSELHGFLPWTFSKEPLETFVIYRVVSP